jgi:TolB protein
MLRSWMLLPGVVCLVSAQPRTIVFSRIGNSQIGVFVSNADGTGERPLLKSDSAGYNPVWSPDGKWIAFTSERNGSADLYRVKADGTGLERLTDSPAYDDQAAFSPDGRQVVFVSTRASGTADLWILDLGTRKARLLTSGGGNFRPASSPDGEWIAFTSDRGSTIRRDGGGQWWVHLQIADLYLIRPDGSELKRITNDGNFCGGPKWTADNRHLIGYCMSAEETFKFRSPPNLSDKMAQAGRAPLRGDTRLVLIDVATLERTAVATGPGIKIFPSVLKDGDLAYIRKDVDGPGLYYNKTGKMGPRGAVRAPSWSPDGATVVYHRLLSMEVPAWKKIWSPNPGYKLAITDVLPAFDPSGKYLVATPHGENTKLVIIETGRNTSRPFFDGGSKMTSAAQWSPRGDIILFGLGQYFRNRAQGAQVAMIKPDGSGLRELTSGANNNGFPSFAPDGKRIVYRTFGPEGQGLRIMNLDNPRVTMLTEDYDNFPKWSPRGDLIMFARRYQGSFDIFTIAPDGTNLKRLSNTQGDDSHMDWSPDGEWIAFSSGRTGFKDEALNTDSTQPYGEIFVMRYDGTQVQQLTDNQWEDGGPAWLPAPNARLKH